MLIVSEVSELHNVYRNRTGLAGRFEDEVRKEAADIAIRLFSFCLGNGIDLERGITEKHEINKGRPYRHGKDF